MSTICKWVDTAQPDPGGPGLEEMLLILLICICIFGSIFSGSVKAYSGKLYVKDEVIHHTHRLEYREKAHQEWYPYPSGKHYTESQCRKIKRYFEQHNVKLKVRGIILRCEPIKNTLADENSI